MSDGEGTDTGGAGRRGREPDPYGASNLLQAIIEASPDPIVVLDEELRVKLWNPAAEMLFGWSEEEILDRRAPFVPEEKESEFLEGIARLDAKQPNRSLETVRRAKDGERIAVSISSAKVETGEDFAGYVGIFKDIRRRKERERVLEQQRTTLVRVMQIIEGLRPLNHAIARASSPEEIKQGVCEQLASSDAYQFVWYGDYNPAAGRLTVQHGAGIDAEALGSIDLASEKSEGQRVFGAAIHTGDTRAIQDTTPDPALEPQAQGTGEFPGGYRSVAAVPVAFEGSTYGVIGVYSERQRAFGGYERGLLREVGELIGHGIQAVENQRLLHSETVIELEFSTRGPESIFVKVTEDLDCRLELEAFIPATETAFLAYTSVDGADPGTVVERLADSPAIETARVVNADGAAGTIEYKVNESPVAKLLEYGATVQTAIMEAGEERVVAVVSPEKDIHHIVAGLEVAYSNTTLVSKRSLERPPRTISAAQDPLGDVLTDRQREMLELAYHAGYFESPRHSTGDEIADSIGISSPTFYLHVRKATHNLLQWLEAQELLD